MRYGVAWDFREFGKPADGALAAAGLSLSNRCLRQSVFVGAFANEVDGESAVVMQEHVGAVAVDGAVGEQHADGECGLHVIRQIHELLVGVPIRMHGDGRVRHVGVSVAVLVHIAHERQIPSVMIGELLLEILYLGEYFIADAQVFRHLVGFGCFGVGVLVEHVEIHGDDGFLVCHG